MIITNDYNDLLILENEKTLPQQRFACSKLAKKTIVLA